MSVTEYGAGVTEYGAGATEYGAGAAAYGAGSPDCGGRAAAETRDAWSFAQVDDFWERYEPLTPWGKDDKEARALLADAAEIEARYDDVDAALAFLRSADRVSADRVSYHLRRMPRLTLERKDSYELIELFQIKKFLANYRGAAAALDEPSRVRFGFARPCAALAAELDRGGSDPETFYLADCYDEGLAEARAAIARADEALRGERARADAQARLSFGVSFDGREFLVVPRDVATAMLAGTDGSGGRFSAEPYDDGRYVVRVVPSPAAVALMAERSRLLALEAEREAAVVARLSALAGVAMPELRAAAGVVARWDRARAGAVLALALGLSRPRLGAGRLALEKARFLPCAWECERMGLSYSPLSARFDADAVVLFGSNMGGKTVVLKTVVFFQLVAQAGLFVPAERFETDVFDRVEYVGELSGERLAGLSGFGLEVWRLGKAWEGGASGRALVAYDELARTTGSHEAEALLSAVVEAYAGGLARDGAARRADRAFFATHFRGVARLPGVEYRRMRGLDRVAAAASLEAPGSPTDSLERRLSGINGNMRYEVVDDDGSGRESDALAIAGLLGLDRAIVERARYYLEKDGL